MNFYEEIDKENEAARKRWLQYSLFYFIGYPFLIFLMATFSIFFSPLNTAAWQAEGLKPELTIILSLVSFGMTNTATIHASPNSPKSTHEIQWGGCGEFLTRFFEH